jgi:dipeptidyl aminopeptidase/acylaminoacyl peptidase
MNILKLIRNFTLCVSMLSILGCSSLPDMHDNAADKTTPVWEQTASKGSLKVNFLWAKPIEKGPLPTIMVHPGMLQNAQDMRGVLIDLADQGFISVAIDYQRLVDGEWQTSTMPLRNKDEIDFILDQVTQNPWVDSDNIGLLGFSLGGAHSLKIAENNPLIKAVVVYYPMTDFVRWAKSFEDDFILSFIVKQIKASYLDESIEHTDATHLALVSQYSAINFTNKIKASVLVIHGDNDKIAPVEYSKSFVKSLQLSGNQDSKLVVINKGSHGFNFQRSEKSLQSWFTSLNWMSKRLGTDSKVNPIVAVNAKVDY